MLPAIEGPPTELTVINSGHFRRAATRELKDGIPVNYSIVQEAAVTTEEATAVATAFEEVIVAQKKNRRGKPSSDQTKEQYNNISASTFRH